MKKIVKHIWVILFLVVLAFSSTSCGNVSEPTLRVVFMTNTTRFNEKGGMNEQIRNTLSTFSGGNVSVKIVQPMTQEEQVPTLRELADSGEYDLILCAGYTTGKAVDVVSQEYADQLFGTIDYISNASNVFSVVFSEEQAAFYCGVMAALMTETGVVGLVSSFAGIDVEYHYGFKAGVQAVDPEIVVVEQYTNAYEDITTAEGVIAGFEEADVDVFYTSAAAPTSRLIELAGEKNMKVLNANVYTYSQESSSLACIVNKEYASSVEYVLNMTAEYLAQSDEGETLISTDLRYVGIDQNAYKFQLAASVDKSVREQLDKLVLMFQDGTPIVIPRDERSFSTFDYSIFEGKFSRT